MAARSLLTNNLPDAVISRRALTGRSPYEGSLLPVRSGTLIDAHHGVTGAFQSHAIRIANPVSRCGGQGSGRHKQR